MARIELVNSGVEFLEEPHEYWLTLPNGEKKQLSGITSAIQRQVAGHEYDGCPEYLIRRSGDYGKSVHKSIEMLINDFENDGTVEVDDFIRLTADMSIEASEYMLQTYLIMTTIHAIIQATSTSLQDSVILSSLCSMLRLTVMQS